MPGGLSPAVLKPVTFTFVEYEEGDALGKLLAYISLLPVFIGYVHKHIAEHFVASWDSVDCNTCKWSPT